MAAWRARCRECRPLMLVPLLAHCMVSCTGEDAASQIDASAWFHDHFPATEADAIDEDFANQKSLLEWAVSDQRGFPTPLGALPAGGRVVSTSPFVILFENFLTDDECEFLKTYAKRKLEPAMVVLSNDDWYGKQGQTRSNEQTWFQQNQERQIPILRHIMKRMHRIARVPDEYAEALQVGRYNKTNKYEGHLDTDPTNGVGRPMTMITYLADVESGGDTLFPIGRSDCGVGWHKHPETGEKVYGCELCCNSPEKDANTTIRVNAKKGRAVLFFNHFPDGSVDGKAKHIGCPVNEGVKWIAQRWFRFEPYNRVSYHKVDQNDPSLTGWDHRYDGKREISEDRASERNFRTLSHTNPKAYMEDNFFSQEEASKIRELVQPSDSHDWTELEIDDKDTEEHSLLHELRSRAYLLARMRPNAPSTLKLRRFFQGAQDKPQIGAVQQKQGTQEVAFSTVTAYLRIPEQGGGLAILNKHDALTSEECTGGDAEACCARQDVFKVKPAEGDAVLLYNYGQDYHLDDHRTRFECPVLQGEAWLLEWTFWSIAPKMPKKKEATSDKQPSIQFTNMEGEALKIYWVPPYGGKETFIEDLGAHPTVKQIDTYNGHSFHIRDAAGDLVQKVIANAKPHQPHEIRRKSKSEL